LQELKLAGARCFVFLNDFSTDNVAGHQVRRKLDPAKIQVQGTRQRADHQRFRQSWHAFEQTMASGKDRNHQLLDDFVLPNDHFAQLAPNRLVSFA